MEKSTVVRESFVNGTPNHQSFSSASGSLRHVKYSCGACGYELNLSSSNRNTSTVGSKYGKSIKRGVISFFSIDESRFKQVDEFQCIPYFSKKSWGLFRRRTKLLCHKCGNQIGVAYENDNSDYSLVVGDTDSSSVSEASKRKLYNVKIRALQPSTLSTPLCHFAHD